MESEERIYYNYFCQWHKINLTLRYFTYLCFFQELLKKRDWNFYFFNLLLVYHHGIYFGNCDKFAIFLKKKNCLGLMVKWIQFAKFLLAMLTCNICNYWKLNFFGVKFQLKNLNLHFGYLQPHENNQIATYRDLSTYQMIWIPYYS